MNRDSTTQNTYNRAAQSYWEKKSPVTLYNASFDTFFEMLPQNAPVFELGCGPGNVSQYLLGKRPDLTITGIDLAPNMVALAKANNPTAHYRVMDCRSIAAINQKFDAILAAFVLPYLTKKECKKLIADCTALLTDKGSLYLSTMEGDYSTSGFETASFSPQNKVHIHYHQEDFIKECLTQSGFELIHLIKQPCPEPDGRVFTDMIFIAKKK